MDARSRLALVRFDHSKQVVRGFPLPRKVRRFRTLRWLGYKVQAEVRRDLVDELYGNRPPLPGVSRDQRLVTNAVNQPGYALGIAMNRFDGLDREDCSRHRTRAPDALQPLFDVLQRLCDGVRLQTTTDRDPLFQLPQLKRIQFGVELRLPHQHNLD